MAGTRGDATAAAAGGVLRSRALAAFRAAPAAFVPNLGQWAGAARFVARRGPMSVHVFADSFGVLLANAGAGPSERIQPSPAAPGHSARVEPVDATAIRFWFVGAAQSAQPEGRAPLPTRFNYFVGADPSRWRAGVTGYRSIWYAGLYDGVDLALRGGEEQPFEYDLHFAPGANLASVVVCVEGAVSPLRIDGDGALVVATRLGPLRQPRPVAFEETGRGPRRVGCSYEILGPRQFRFRVQGTDRSAALVIDPQLQYSTYLGGNAWDEAFALAVDAAGAVVAGRTFAADFPTRNAWQTNLAGASDAFVARLALAGGPPVYATYLGGSADDEARVIALDASGGALLAGATASLDFPTRNPLQASNAGGLDAFVTWLSPSGGSLVYSTYLGGRGVDGAVGLALHASGAAAVAGGTSSADFPTRSAFQANNAGGYDGFLALVPLTGGPPAYSTYFGGSADDGAVSLALDASGVAVLAGWTQSADFPTRNAFQPALAGATDAFVARLPLSPGPPTCSTYLGGSAGDVAYALGLDSNGAVVAGGTSSADFPTRNAFQSSLAGPSDAFVTRVALSGAPPSESTYLGGTATETALALALDASGGVVVAGWTFSVDFPTRQPFQPRHAGVADVFLARLAPGGGPPTYATFLGGSGLDKPYALAVDASRTAVVVGLTDSTDFPIRHAFQATPAGSFDVFVTRLDLLPPGVSAFGSSTPGCAGPLVAGASSIAQVGNSAFALTCESAPPNSTGLLGASSARLPSPLVIFGAAVWIDPAAPVFALVPGNSNGLGVARVPMPIPPNPGLVGAQVFAQFFWADTCAAGGVSASNALQLVVQG